MVTQSQGKGGGDSARATVHLFYLLFYLRLVVQVMSVGVSLGQGSMKANLLVMKKRDGE